MPAIWGRTGSRRCPVKTLLARYGQPLNQHRRRLRVGVLWLSRAGGIAAHDDAARAGRGGTWSYAEYPPYYFAVPPYTGAGVIAAGIMFGTGYALGRWGNYRGGGCNWSNNNFFINRSNTVNNIANNWRHNPAHRQTLFCLGTSATASAIIASAILAAIKPMSV